jgi:hypothetical protein
MWRIDPIQIQVLPYIHIIYTDHVSKSGTVRKLREEERKD